MKDQIKQLETKYRAAMEKTTNEYTKSYYSGVLHGLYQIQSMILYKEVKQLQAMAAECGGDHPKTGKYQPNDVELNEVIKK